MCIIKQWKGFLFLDACKPNEGPTKTNLGTFKIIKYYIIIEAKLGAF